ncbi:MAG: ATP-dependent helicase, partial [Acidimicrobiia bacterium]|nr:ATP-dependent helicase [Acidimicrobiia bacterium]
MITPSAEQQAIIEFPLAPLRVAAGAGTGKTTTMALRISHLVNTGVLEPEAALGVTFTNKAAEELADRVRSQLPDLASEGREVEVTTYHGFAHRLLREFGPIVGVERNAPLVTAGYSRQLLKDALGDGQYELLDLAAPSQRVAELATLAGQLGDHLRTPGELAAMAATDEVSLRRNELARTLERYAKRKKEMGAVDYPDLIRLAHRLVSDHPEIAARIRNRYGVVLLDEYQDTNPAQRELMRTVFGNGFPVTAVGDPDQTIYEWRGASLANFAGFPIHFPRADGTPATTLTLTRNRRSDQNIITLAERVRNEIGDSAGIDQLRALDDAQPGQVHVGWFRTAVEEANWVAEEARRLHDEDGVVWSDIAVLFRKNRQIPLVRDAFEAQDIAIDVVSLGGLLHVPEVADLHAWLRLLGRPDDSPALMRLLLGPHFSLGLGDVGPLANWVRARQRGEPDALRWTLVEAVDAVDSVTDLGPEARRRLDRFRDIYRDLLETAQGVTLVELCRRILDRMDVWIEVDGMGEAGRLSARLNLYRFLDLAEEWSPLEGRPSLDAFLDYLDLLDEEAAPDELDTARLGGDIAVSLITIHRAKGLEWPVVFVPALLEKVFPVRGQTLNDEVLRHQVMPAALSLDPEDPPNPDDNVRKAALSAKHLSQEWRTAYVAVTRAEHLLYFTGAFWYGTSTVRKPSPLFDMARELPGVIVDQNVEEPGPAPGLLRFDDMQTAPDPLFADGWTAALREAAAGNLEEPDDPTYDERMTQLTMVLDGLPDEPEHEAAEEPFRTSVTGLVTYATCPRRFYWSEIDRLPRKPAESKRRGVELH